MIFSTERLVIRAWTEGDNDVLVDLYSRWEVVRWLGGEPALAAGPAEAAARLERWHARSADDRAYGVWAVTLDGWAIGTVLLVLLPGDVRVEVGWHLHPDHWGAGYATEAARGAVRYGFDSGLTEIFAVVDPANHRSLAVVGRLGMTLIGRTDQYYDDELDLFRLTRAEFRGGAGDS